MKRGIVFEGLLRFMAQQRRNNFHFFEDCSVNRKRGPSAFIPFENLGTLELGGMTGNVGKEIYGAGFFFQAEDGIRDDLVTGVQTFALPISTRRRPWHPRRRSGGE